MGFPAWTAHVSRAGHGEGDARLGQRARHDRRPARSGRATRSSPTTTACASCRGSTWTRRVTASAARVAKEEQEPQAARRRRARPGHVQPAAQAREGRPDQLRRVRQAGRRGTASGRRETMSDGIRCMQMRGGTSKGAYFLAERPARRTRQSATTCCCGSWAARTRGRSTGSAARTRSPPRSRWSPRAPTARRRRRLPVPAGHGRPAGRHRQAELRQHPGRHRPVRGRARPGRRAPEQTSVRIRMVNTDSIVTATFPTPDGVPRYDGDTAIDGVPGTAAPIVLDFEDRRLGHRRVLPTGQRHRHVRRHHRDLRGQRDAGRRGRRDQLRQDRVRVRRRARGRRGAEQAGPGAAARGGQGDGPRRRVSGTTVPKISLVAAPADGGTISTTDLHPGPGARVDRGARRGQRRHRVSCSPARSAATWPSITPGAAPARHRAPQRAAPGRGRAGPRRAAAEGAPLGRGAHRAQALRRHRLPEVAR